MVQVTPDQETMQPLQSKEKRWHRINFAGPNGGTDSNRPLPADPVQAVVWGGRLPSRRRAITGGLSALGIGEGALPLVHVLHDLHTMLLLNPRHICSACQQLRRQHGHAAVAGWRPVGGALEDRYFVPCCWLQALLGCPERLRCGLILAIL